jgi:hypothetical protein
VPATGMFSAAASGEDLAPAASPLCGVA